MQRISSSNQTGIDVTEFDFTLVVTYEVYQMLINSIWAGRRSVTPKLHQQSTSRFYL